MDLKANAFVDAFLREGDEVFWACEEMHRLVMTDLEAAWEVTLLLVERARSDRELGRVAAGPLEDLIDIHGHKALDRIEEACDNNLRLRLTLNEVAVLFYYDEFDRWYALLCKYGFRQVPTTASRIVIPKVMHLMNSFLNKNIGVADYESSMGEVLNSPLDDKRAQRILQAASYIVILNDTAPPEHRTPQMIRDSELRARVKQSLHELESLDHCASG